jgi:hypothetical protein
VVDGSVDRRGVLQRRGQVLVVGYGWVAELVVCARCGMCAEADGRRRVGRRGVGLDICLDNLL